VTATRLVGVVADARCRGRAYRVTVFEMPGEQLPLGRGRSPWREPRRVDDWIATVAWLQAGLLVACAALLALLNRALADVDALECWDRDPAACAASDSPWFTAADAVALGVMATAAITAIVLARRNLRARGSRAAALSGIAATGLAVAAAALLA
jgi:hypothetical protein